MSRIPNVYLPPFDTPLYWMDEESGELRAAVMAYFAQAVGNNPGGDNPEPAPAQMDLLRDYLAYVINAPCWNSGAFKDELAWLRQQVSELRAPADFDRWLEAALAIGIDAL